jgi:hypothetical protein
MNFTDLRILLYLNTVKYILYEPGPDPTFAFVGGPCCPTLDFVIALWIMITVYTLLTSLFCIVYGTHKAATRSLQTVKHKSLTQH